MPKFYVSFLKYKYIVLAKDHIDACVVVSTKYNNKTTDQLWKVSEQGFDDHYEDRLIPDKTIKKHMGR